MSLFEQISVNMTTGALSYPALPGFTLDMARVYSAAALHYPFCNGSMEMAVKHAVHGQLAAYQGAMSLFPSRKAG